MFARDIVAASGIVALPRIVMAFVLFETDSLKIRCCTTSGGVLFDRPDSCSVAEANKTFGNATVLTASNRTVSQWEFDNHRGVLPRWRQGCERYSTPKASSTFPVAPNRMS